MSGFEVIVRPVVLPNIRPAAARVLPAEDDPAKGIATIGGGGGKFVGISHSTSISFSQQRPHKESTRQFNKERILQVAETTAGGATIMNPENYVEVERLKRVRLETSDGAIKVLYADPPLPQPNNIVVLATDVVRKQ